MGFDQSLASDLHDTTSFFNGAFNAQSVTVTICCALALYNALLLLMLIFITFKKFRGLYFWSLVISSSGIIPYTVAVLIEYFQLTSQIAGLVITLFGWPMMVTGQSFVLYSRLGVVLGQQNRALLKWVKWMIIVDGLVFHIPTMVVCFGAYCVPPGKGGHAFMLAYKYIEKIQMTGFTIQEFILSGLYVWRTLQILNTSTTDRKRTRRVLWQLFSINVVIIALDVALLVVEYQDRHVIEQALKGVFYSVKLKFEFAILSKLAGITRQDDQTFLAAFEDFDDIITHDRSESTDHIRRGSSIWLSHRRSKSDIEKRIENLDDAPSTSAQSNKVSHETVSAPLSVATADQQRRRKTLEEDLYAATCRDLAG